MDDTRKESRVAKATLKVGLTVVIGIGFLIGILDIKEILSVARRINPIHLFWGLLSTTLSLFFLALALGRLLSYVGQRLAFREVFAVSWVSTSLNNMFATGGVAGLTMRVLLLKKSGISFSETFLVSFVHTLLVNTVLIGFVVFGFAHLIIRGELSTYQYVVSVAILALCLVFAFLAAGSVFNRPLREWFIDRFYRLINWIGFKFTKRRPLQPADLDDFKGEFHEGLSSIFSRRTHILLPGFYVFLDWFCCLMTLYFAFKSVAYEIAPGILIVGFAVGIFIPLISFIPAAIGIMEGSMAAVFYSLGVPVEVAVIAVLVFRVVLHVFPFMASLLMYRPLLWEAKTAEQFMDVG